MKLNKNILLLLCSILMIQLNIAAQHKSDEELKNFYIELVLDVSEAIPTKGFIKTWKTEREEWEQKCNSAQLLKELSPLVVEMIEKMDAKVFGSGWEKKKEKWTEACLEVTTWNDFGLLLIDFESNLSSSAYSSEWKKERAEWVNEVKQANKEYVKAEEAKNPTLKMNEEEFKIAFEKIFSVAQSGLKALIQGEEKKADSNHPLSYWETDFLLTGAMKAVIENNQDHGVLRYHAFFIGGTSKENAEKNLSILLRLIEPHVPAVFGKKEQFSYSSVNNKEILFEYKSDKLAEILHRPSILISIQQQDNALVIIMDITEAYYKSAK